MSQYWLDWATDVGLVLVVAVVLVGGIFGVYKVVRRVLSVWDEETGRE